MSSVEAAASTRILLLNELLLFATDPLGTPLANADVRIKTPNGTSLTAKTDEPGIPNRCSLPSGIGAGATPRPHRLRYHRKIGRCTVRRFDGSQFTKPAGISLAQLKMRITESGFKINLEIVGQSSRW